MCVGGHGEAGVVALRLLSVRVFGWAGSSDQIGILWGKAGADRIEGDGWRRSMIKGFITFDRLHAEKPEDFEFPFPATSPESTSAIQRASLEHE